MSTITFIGGPFDGKQIDESDLCDIRLEAAATALRLAEMSDRGGKQ